jgi:DNA-binding MarR family transcriptional regulator
MPRAVKPAVARPDHPDAPAAPSPPEGSAAPAQVLQQFRIVFNAVKTHFQQVERQTGVGGAQVWALSIIRDRPGIGVNSLAATLNIRQPTASNLVRNLALHSLIEVRREGEDRRAVQLHATAAGRRMLRRSPGPFAGVLLEALTALDPDALHRLEGDLAKLIRQLGADESAATIPMARL